MTSDDDRRTRQVTVEIIRSATNRAHLASHADAQFGDMVKAVVDVRRLSPRSWKGDPA